jgi:excisionase family DNA binding protein
MTALGENAMSEEMMNTKEVAQYLGIHEKQVYALIRAKKIPASRVTGKWLFPKKVIDGWIETSARSGLAAARQKSGRIAGALLAAGSNDPVLDILQTSLRKAHPEYFLFSANTGSKAGLEALKKGYIDIAWSHLLDPLTGEYNIPYLESLLPEVGAVLVNLFLRELGFIVPKGNPLRIRGFEDLGRGGIRLVNRQAGSGTRLLLDHHLSCLGIDGRQIEGYDEEVYTHFEVGLAVHSGTAATGLATAAVSAMLDLDFIPAAKERFDMVCRQSTFFEKGVQALMEVLKDGAFRRRVEKLGNYDFSIAGRIVHVQGQARE